MESIAGNHSRSVHGATKQATSGARNLGHQLRAAGGQEATNLMADVHDLLGTLAHIADPEIARLKAKVQTALEATKKAYADGTDVAQRRAKAALNATDDYVHDQPWQVVGIAAIAGLVAGFLIGRR